MIIASSGLLEEANFSVSPAASGVNRLLVLSLDPAHVHSRLRAYFAEDVDGLEEVLQRDLPRWCYWEESAA